VSSVIAIALILSISYLSILAESKSSFSIASLFCYSSLISYYPATFSLSMTSFKFLALSKSSYSTAFTLAEFSARSLSYIVGSKLSSFTLVIFIFLGIKFGSVLKSPLKACC